MPKKRNPQDATLRNTRAANKKFKQIWDRIAEFENVTCKRALDLEMRVLKLERALRRAKK